MFENSEKGIAQHPQLALPNGPNEDIWCYNGLFQINPIVFDYHLVMMLQVPLVDKSLIMNVYNVDVTFIVSLKQLL